MSFSAIGRSALALASVVTIASAANSEAARLAIISFWCWELPPKLRARRGVAGMVGLFSDQPRRDRPLSSSFPPPPWTLYRPKFLIQTVPPRGLLTGAPAVFSL